MDEWARQIRRWIIGSSESFHYFLTHYRGRPFFAGLRWFLMFFVYYAVLLCCAGLFTAAAAVPLPGSVWPHEFLRYAGLVSLVLQYSVFAVAFVIDRCAIRHMTVKENVSFFRNFIHWLVSPLVLLVYSLIAFYAVVKFAFRGKKDAGHVMAAKAGFQAVTAVRAEVGAEAQTSQTAQASQAEESFAEESFHSRCEDEGRQNPLEGRGGGLANLATCTAPPIRPGTFHALSDGALSYELNPRPMSFPLSRQGLDPSVCVGEAANSATNVEDKEDKVLCHLPDSFYFGSMPFPTLPSGRCSQGSPQVFTYGL